ncbi:MAG: glycosyltransferase family 2 protein, partial [Candidatus Omnitrophica bacterium]|nr:glycosyltransferase family 2 protein [Candidatus Omnitrophota bacterium]
MNNLFLAGFTYTVFVIFLGYFLLLISYYLFLGIVGFIESKKWVMKKEEEDYPLNYFTTFDIPVSIIIPAHNEELWIADAVKSALNLNYPKFELIIVDDGSTDGTFNELNKFLDFKPAEMIYIRHYKDGKVFDILKSQVNPNVTVIRKGRGQKKAGAVNAGLNIAKYDYVCVLDADSVVEQDALLKVMAEVNKDPQRIVGIGSYFSLSNGFKVRDGIIVEKKFSYQPLIAYQHLEYIRSFFGSRVGWSRFNAMPIVAGGFGVWRRDVLYELGGYASEFTCEDIEFTFRAHKYIADNKKPYRILMLPYFVSWTDGPQ